MEKHTANGSPANTGMKKKWNGKTFENLTLKKKESEKEREKTDKERKKTDRIPSSHSESRSCLANQTAPQAIFFSFFHFVPLRKLEREREREIRRRNPSM